MGRYAETDWPLTLAGPIDYSKPFPITVELMTGIHFDGVCGDATGFLLLMYSFLQRSGLDPMQILAGGDDGFLSVHENLGGEITTSSRGGFF